MTTSVKGLRPIHPGEILREDVIPGCGLSKTKFAEKIGLSREALHNILVGKSAVSTVVAPKLSRLLGTSPEMWLNMQQADDLAVTSEARRQEIERVEALEMA